MFSCYACPICASPQTVKNEWSHPHRETTVQSHNCGRQFVEQPAKKVIDQATRELIDRLMRVLEVATHKLWASLPPVYRQCAITYTDFWAAYGAVLSSKRHRAVGRQTGKTSYLIAIQQYIR